MRQNEYIPVVPSPSSLISVSTMDTTSSSSSASSHRRSSHNDIGHVFSPLSSPPPAVAAAVTVAMAAPPTHYYPGGTTLTATPTILQAAPPPPPPHFGFADPSMMMMYMAGAAPMPSQQIRMLSAPFREQQAALTPQSTPPTVLRSPVTSAVMPAAGVLLSPERGAVMPLGYASSLSPAAQLQQRSFSNGVATMTTMAPPQPVLLQPVLSVSGGLEFQPQYFHQPMVTAGTIRTPDSEYRDSAVSSSNGFLGADEGISDAQALQREHRLYSVPASDPTIATLSSGRRSFYCSACKLNFLYRRELEQHFMQHRGKQKSILCHVCGKCFPRPDHVNRHAASKHTTINYACQLCDAEFSRAYNLHKHWKEVHPNCVGVITNDRATATSSASATDEEQKSDSQLDDVDIMAVSPTTTSMISATLAIAQQQHRDTRDSTVATGGSDGSAVPTPTMVLAGGADGGAVSAAAAPASSVVRRGVRGAPNLPRKYSCEKCHRCFARAAHLQRHRRIHTGEKPFTCFKCHRIYARNDYLRTHLTTQHNRNAMDCEVCMESFDTVNKLLDHMKTRHGRTRPWFLQPSDRADGDGHAAAAASGDQDDDAWSTCCDVDQHELGAHTSMDAGHGEEEAEEEDEEEEEEENLSSSND